MKRFFVALLLVNAAIAQAQYPDRAIKLVVPFTPGRFSITTGTFSRSCSFCPQVRAGLLKQGLSPLTGTPAQLAKLIETDLERWGRLVREAGIAAD